MTSKYHLALCTRCLGTGRYDRGACFGCRAYGAAGWVKKAKAGKSMAQVTAIRDEAEGRIKWVLIHDATNKQAVDIVTRQMRVKGLPAALIASVQASQV